MDDKDKQKSAVLIGAYITIPFVLAIPPIVGWYLGVWLDSVFGFSPFLKYALMLLGIIAGFREVFRIIKSVGSED